MSQAAMARAIKRRKRNIVCQLIMNCPMCLILWARFRSLFRTDTRLLECFSATLKIVWCVGLWLDGTSSSYARIDQFLDAEIVAAGVIPFGLFHLWAIVAERGGLRRFCILVGVAWWAFLAYLMAQFPPNYAALLTYSAIAFFCGLCYLAARLRGEV